MASQLAPDGERRMTIELHEITVGDLLDGYMDSGDEGAVAYGGRLNVRPAFQREFIYRPEQQRAVVETVLAGYPLNCMYWIRRGDGRYDLLDGQQRTLSLCRFADNRFSVGDTLYYHGLLDEQRAAFRGYRLQVYLCAGSEAEKLKWFEIINTQGEPLKRQEMRNALHPGPWVYAAKKWFGRNGCPAQELGARYVKGDCTRQDYLEKALAWLAADPDRPERDIDDYMGRHQNDADCAELWNYFERVFRWVAFMFPEYQRDMKGREWGLLYNKWHGKYHTAETRDAWAAELRRLRLDDEVDAKSGIYEYLMDGDERHLKLRAFPEGVKATVYARQTGKCARCGAALPIEQMEADHITPWSKGGKTVIENCQLLCQHCNRTKSDT